MADPIAIVIVTYNSGDHIGFCLDAAIRHSGEIVVVDNGSSDQTVEFVRQRPVRLIANRENRGFAGAVNQGIAATQARYILLLNPDAVIEGGLEALREACDLPASAGAGGTLLHPDGRPQVGFMVRRFPTVAALTLEALLLNRVWPGNPVNRRYRYLDLNYATRSVVEQPAGAFLMLRRDVWSRLSGLDEKYHPLWFEDVDYCRRAANAGYRMFFVPEAVAKHTGGHSIPKIAVQMRVLYWYRSFLGYTVRHFQPGGARVVCLSVMAGSVLRMIGGILRDRNLQSVAVYGKVIRLAGRCFAHPATGEM